MSASPRVGSPCRCFISRSTPAGFTLIELMVSIAIISVLITLSLGAMSGARRGAREVECRVILRSVGMGHEAQAVTNGGYWMNSFSDTMNETFRHFNTSDGAWGTSYWAQVRTWSDGLIGTYWEDGDPASIWTCPEVLHRRDQGFNDNPRFGAFSSYYYSAALISSPGLWDPDDRSAMKYYNDYRRRVAVHEVAYPSQKAALAEIADFHAKTIRPATDPDVEHLNTLFCDGHVERVRIVDAVPGLEITNMFYFDGISYAPPFVGTPDGYLGVDRR